ncbi:thiol:disulfide interchange protein DsbA/DsbL [Kinneretia aquatilis]|uniref:thiol:disulfide interchange protein DsbA/DsbL n=1 Tax=Kinneretia aquatilis TaxID=2070761 RepID=UPI002557D916|nr:thiol:disulfide interchange protein DsbA/DsbL [Paucibacter aquatile]WIV97631.1 thiol:disulfide interchange protein DsbA/DsbL [Paucibacter aquatile]
MKMMKRREFSALLSAPLSLGALGTLAAAPQLALAQTDPFAGKYQTLSQALPSSTPGKIEVVEFFWYGCPHCYAFEPVLAPWIKQLPADVAFRRVHVGFNAMIKQHQKLFYALEALGKAAELQDKIFNAFHVERLDLNDEKSITELVVKLGVDGAKFKDAYNAFGVVTKAGQGTKLSEAYRIDGVPALGIGGRYLTSPSIAGLRGDNEQANGRRALAVADHLIQLARASKG